MTTTVRSVRVELEMGIAGYVANARIAGHETDKAFGSAEERISATSRAVSRLDRNTGNLAKTSTESRIQQSSLGREIEKTGRSASRSEAAIDKYSGRLKTIAGLALTLGPALLRLAAGALPAVTAGIAGIGAGAAGLGVALIALQGFDKALKALSTYKLAPTAENLQKLRIEEEKLGPAGAQFLHYLDQLQPKLKDIQNVARAGLFPGVEAGIDDLLTRLPLVRQTVHRVSQEMGVLASDAGSALASDEWTPFFDYVHDQAAPILDDFARSTGNVALGLANMLVAFDPLSQRFTGGLVDMTSRFADWSKTLDDNKGFQSFLDTVEQAGPELADFAGSTIHLLAGVARASAPLGQVTLPILTGLLKVLAAIADSPAGPALYAAAAGLIAFNRASSLVSKSSEKVSLAWSRMNREAATFGAIGLMATQVTTLDDKLGLTNTAMYSMAGLIAGGPWGAAVGAAVGQYQDLNDATTKWTDNIRKADAALASGNTDQLTEQLGNLQSQYDKLLADVPNDPVDFLGTLLTPSKLQGNNEAMKAYADRIAALKIALKEGGGVADLFGESIGRTGAELKIAAGDASAFSGALGILNGWFDKRDAVRGYKDAIDTLAKSMKDGFTRDDAAKLDALGRSILQVATNIKSPKVRGDFLAEARAKLEDMAQHAAPKAAAAIQEVVDKFDEKGLTHPIRPTFDGGPAKAAADDLTHHVRHDFDIMTALESKPSISANNSKFKHTVDATKGQLDDLDGTTAHPHINVEPGNSFGILGGIRSELARIVSKTVTVTVRKVGSALPHFASGGTVPGPRMPYGDKMLIAAAPGEEVISNSRGQADRFRADRAAGRIPAYAAGGTVEDRIRATYTTRFRGYADGGTVDPNTDSTDSTDPKKKHKKPRPPFTAFLPQDVADSLDGVKDAAHRLDRALKGLQTAADKVKASYDKEKSKLDDLISQRSSLASSIASSAVHDPFGNGVAGLDAQVAADTNDIDAMTAALATLVTNGLDPKSALYQALAASMDVNTAQQLAALSAGDLQSRAVAFQHRADEAGVLGGTVAGQEFNAAIVDQTKATRELRGTLKDLQHEIHSIGEQVRQGAHSGAESGSHSGSYEGTWTGSKDAAEGRRRRIAATKRTGGGSR